MSEGTLYISEEMIEELYIRKDKIRAKIKELENKLEELLGDDE